MAVTQITKSSTQQDTLDILTTMLADMAALRTSFNTLVTKLNADAGVTDTNYAAAAAFTTTV